jgi:uncharacterized protein
MPEPRTYTVFVGSRKLVSGSIDTILPETKSYMDGQGTEPVLIFENETGQQVEFDFTGTPDEILQRVLRLIKDRPTDIREHVEVLVREATRLDEEAESSRRPATPD